jgi:hypothetical protein
MCFAGLPAAVPPVWHRAQFAIRLAWFGFVDAGMFDEF